MKTTTFILMILVAVTSSATKNLYRPVSLYPQHFEFTIESGEKIILEMKGGLVSRLEAVSKTGVKCIVPNVVLKEQEIKSVQLNTLRITRDKRAHEGTLQIVFMGNSYFENFLHDKKEDVLHSFWFREGQFLEGPLSSQPTETNKMDRVINHIKESSLDALKK